MKEQMTATGVIVLVSGLTLFWATVAVMIRQHRRPARERNEERQR